MTDTIITASEIVPLNDLGNVFRSTTKEDGVVVDISAATVLQIQFTKPGGAKLLKTSTLTGDGTDGNHEYVRLAGDIDRKGLWSYIGIVTFSATQKFESTTPTYFEVI